MTGVVARLERLGHARARQDPTQTDAARHAYSRYRSHENFLGYGCKIQEILKM
jgi:hypothetical protein